MDEAKIKARIDELLQFGKQGGLSDTTAASGQLFLGTVTLLGLIHGENSQQLEAFKATAANIQNSKEVVFRQMVEIANTSIGVLKGLKGEVEQGLVGNLRREVTGEVLGDLLQLAKATLDEQTEASKNVAAVLAAAAFEDTIRRMGATFCNLHTRDPLQNVVISLKNAGVLVGA